MIFIKFEYIYNGLKKNIIGMKKSPKQTTEEIPMYINLFFSSFVFSEKHITPKKRPKRKDKTSP